MRGKMVGRTLTDRVIRQTREPGVLIDGRGLRVRITKNRRTGQLRKSWVFRVKIKGGTTRELGLGSVEDLSLTDARDRARSARRLARDGIDPLAARDAERAAKAADAARAISFEQCAGAYIAAHKAAWRNEKHAAQWKSTLGTYAYPVIGAVSAQAVDVALVMKVLEPIWSEKTETASRVRQRIEAVLDWAKVRNYRRGENPARWRGHLDKLLPARAKVKRVVHHPALPYARAPALYAKLAETDTAATLALRFLILTATRTSETLNAKWTEFDLDEKVWTIPAARMKAARAHRVPLGAQALALLGQAKPLHGKEDWVFPGGKAERPLSNMVFLKLLARLEYTDITAHGFRSSFRDWAAEKTNFPREVAEAALAHTLSDKVEAAYRRTDLFEKRRALMQSWSLFISRELS